MKKGVCQGYAKMDDFQMEDLGEQYKAYYYPFYTDCISVNWPDLFTCSSEDINSAIQKARRDKYAASMLGDDERQIDKYIALAEKALEYRMTPTGIKRATKRAQLNSEINRLEVLRSERKNDTSIVREINKLQDKYDRLEDIEEDFGLGILYTL